MCIADTPEQQIRPAVTWLMKERDAKNFYLIGDDYVWPRKSNEHAKKYIAENGGKVVGEEYVPFGAPNKFEEAVTRIKCGQARRGADHPGRRRQRQLQPHLRRLRPRQGDRAAVAAARGEHAEGHRRREQQQPVLVHVVLSPMRRATRTRNSRRRTSAKFGDKAPQLSIIGADCYAGVNLRQGAGREGAGHQCPQGDGGLERPGLRQRRRAAWTMHGRHVDKTMYLASCKGTEFEIIKTIERVKHGETCKAA